MRLHGAHEAIAFGPLPRRRRRHRPSQRRPVLALALALAAGPAALARPLFPRARAGQDGALQGRKPRELLEVRGLLRVRLRLRAAAGRA